VEAIAHEPLIDLATAENAIKVW